jgi:outer membrane lipoprotein-sorting protein
VDYEDYRSVGGVKLPFRWTVTWTNGQSHYQIDNWQLNAAVDNARFQKPAPAIVKPVQPVGR